MSALPPPPVPPRPVAGSALAHRDAWIYAAVGALVLTAWWGVSAWGLSAATETGYWLGVAGGLMMLALFAYPLRKRVRVMQRWGAARGWFVVHMVLGIGGPVLILMHSGFHVGSVNAGVALFSMLVVAASGVVGRFLYLRVHRDLSGNAESLASLRAELGLQAQEAHRVFAFAPALEAELDRFDRGCGACRAHWARMLLVFTWLPWRRAQAAQRSRRALRSALRHRGAHTRQASAQLRREEAALAEKLQRYLWLAQRVAQYDSAKRLLALWHVLHVPFVYLMVVCAVVHIVAVHVY